MAKLKLLWLLTVAAAFWGPFLAISSHPQAFAFRILFLGHLVVLASIALFSNELSTHLKQVKIRDQLWFFLFWLFWATISIFWADSRIDAVMHIWALFSGIAIIVITVLYTDTDRDLTKYSRLILATFLLFSFIGLFEHLTGVHIKPMSTIDPLIYAGEAKFPRVIFSNPNDFATYLALYLPFLYSRAKYCTSWWRKAFGWSTLFFGIYLIMVTQSRANILALFLMTFSALVLYLKDKKLKGFRNLLITGIIIGIVWWGTGYTSYNNLGFTDVVYQLNSLENENQEKGSSIQLRIGLIRGGLDMLKKHVFLGVGAGNAEYHMQDYWLWTRGLTNLHNWWLEVLVNYGVLVWILYLAFYAKLMWNLFTVQHRSKNILLKQLAEAVFLAMTGFLIGAISSSTLYAANFMWFIFALGLAVYNRYLNTES
ncbi:MAG: O-antigen ligase family protein [Carboxydocellales bacterium]